MQLYGDRLDRDTKGRWVRDALRRQLTLLGPNQQQASVVVDAVRKPEQIKAIRSYGYSVVHIHLRAPLEVLAERYKVRNSGLKELSSFSAVATNKTEARVEALERIADIVVDTKLSLPEDVLVRAASHLGLYSREYQRTVDVVVGGQFGSEGKGHIASYLAREYQVLVRVGGPNAGHKVFMDPLPYIHHQLPSGTLRNPLAKLVIAPGAAPQCRSPDERDRRLQGGQGATCDRSTGDDHKSQRYCGRERPYRTNQFYRSRRWSRYSSTDS